MEQKRIGVHIGHLTGIDGTVLKALEHKSPLNGVERAMSQIKVKCPKCGSQLFKQTARGRHAKLTCAKCGRGGTAANIAAPQALKYAADTLKKALKGIR